MDPFNPQTPEETRQLNHQLKAWYNNPVTQAIFAKVRQQRSLMLDVATSQGLSDVGSVLTRERSFGEIQGMLSVENLIRNLIESTETNNNE